MQALMLPVAWHPCPPMGKGFKQSGCQGRGWRVGSIGGGETHSVMRGQSQGQEAVTASHQKPSHSTLNRVYGFGRAPASWGSGCKFLSS